MTRQEKKNTSLVIGLLGGLATGVIGFIGTGSGTQTQKEASRASIQTGTQSAFGAIQAYLQDEPIPPEQRGTGANYGPQSTAPTVAQQIGKYTTYFVIAGLAILAIVIAKVLKVF